MTCVPADTEFQLAQRDADTAELVRAAVFWGFILLVIVSPAILGAMVMAGV